MRKSKLKRKGAYHSLRRISKRLKIPFKIGNKLK